MACLLYCVTLSCEELVSRLFGVADQPVTTHKVQDFRIYWSEVATPEALLEGTGRQADEQKFRSVLREIVARTTALSFPFPAIAADLAEFEKLFSEQQGLYEEALTRLAETVQYELTATWAADDRADLAEPVSGREYIKRRHEAEVRVAAIDTKLKTVTAGIVREWRSRQDRRRYQWFALVPRSDRDRFTAALRSAGPSEGVRLRLSGPWPPGEFVRAQNETQ